MKFKKNLLAAGFAVYVLILILSFSTNIIPEICRRCVQNLLNLSSSVFAFVLAFISYNKYGLKSRFGKILLIFSFGYLFWAIGDFVWFIFESAGISPYPSIADFFYLAAYPIILSGILSAIKLPRISWSKVQILCTSLFVLILIFASLNITLSSAYSSDSTLLENIFSISYVVADVILLIGALALFNFSIQFKNSEFARFWSILSVSFFLTWIGDMFYSVYYSEYVLPNFFFTQIDYFYIGAYILAAYAFFNQIKFIDNLHQFLKKRAYKK